MQKVKKVDHRHQVINITSSNLTAVYLFEISTASLLPIHHVMEDGDHDIPQIRLRHQRHLQEWTNHCWDEVQLVLPLRRGRGQQTG